MRKFRIIPAVALSLLTLGVVAESMPVAAHAVSRVGGEEDDDDSTPATVAGGGGGGGGGGTPSGGAATGGGGMAPGESRNLAPEFAAGAAGLGLVGLSVALRRRKTVGA